MIDAECAEKSNYRTIQLTLKVSILGKVGLDPLQKSGMSMF
jgi:hypothetical protein